MLLKSDLDVQQNLILDMTELITIIGMTWLHIGVLLGFLKEGFRGQFVTHLSQTSSPTPCDSDWDGLSKSDLSGTTKFCPKSLQ